ncbi:MFS transporter [Sulfodiicoccus acidiphilus]|uniref:MFS transporter n=1 Tax=Sulfodiicoccus acidiphilus TaxID=1670455 RepID=A0A348B1X5_9CREN|nr:MFS transporter [Sulfodiicoccus acidiphilus]BBD72177.1 MFS transporter [Sulfodiicoccus acidiphilus]GGT94439.1 MFS transporter [Sulfodiicoccus acidiphilus]
MDKKVIYLALVLFTITFSLRASNNMLMTTVPLVARYDFHFSSAVVGVVASVSSVFAFLGSIINSRLRGESRRKTFVYASLAYAVLFPLFYLSNSVTVWLLSAAIGLAMGLVTPNLINVAGSYEDRKVRERMLSFYTVILSLSLIVGPSIESVVLIRFSLLQAFLFFSVFAATVAGTSFTVKFKPYGGRVTTNREVWKSSGFRAAVFNNLMYSLPFGMLTTFGGIYAVEQFHQSYAVATLLFTAFFGTSLLSRFAFTVRPPKNLWAMIGLSSVLTAGGLLAVAFSPNVTAYAMALLALGVPHGLTFPTSLVLLSRAFPSEEERNVANSFYSALMSGVGSFIPIVLGGIVELAGLRFAFALLVPVSVAFSILLVREYLSQPREERPQPLAAGQRR